MFNIRDKVQITVGPSSKVHRVGTVTSLFTNGAMVQLGKNQFTPIAFEHLKKVEDAEVVQ